MRFYGEIMSELPKISKEELMQAIRNSIYNALSDKLDTISVSDCIIDAVRPEHSETIYNAIHDGVYDFLSKDIKHKEKTL